MKFVTAGLPYVSRDQTPQPAFYNMKVKRANFTCCCVHVCVNV